MDKKEKNSATLIAFKSSLKKLVKLLSGDEEMFGSVEYSWGDNRLVDIVRIKFLSGHHDGKVMIVDSNETFKEVFVRFISNSQDYEIMENGGLKITDTSGNSKIGNYEVRINEI